MIKTLLLKARLHLGEAIYRLFHFAASAPHVGRFDANVRYGPHRKHKLDVVVPDGEGSWPVIVFIHGGGWIVGDKWRARSLCRNLAARDFVAVNVNYRLAPRHRHPCAQQDVAQAVQWVADHITEYGGDPTRTVIAGDSAGAHLAAWHTAASLNPSLQERTGVSIAYTSPAVRALLLFYGIYDMEGFIDSGFPSAAVMVRSFLGPGGGWSESEPSDTASTIRHIDASFPPAYICVGEPDPLAVESQRLAEKLTDLNVPHQFDFFTTAEHPKSTHGFINYLHRDCTQIALDHATQFLHQHLPHA